MRKLLFYALAGALALVATTAAAAAPYRALTPGATANYSEQVPVNYVFVGYEPAQVDQAEFLAGLPAKSDPVVRSRLWYGVTERLGLHYTFAHDVTYTDAAWEDKFFGALSKLAKPADRTLFQNTYNAQRTNILNVGQNHFIDAPTVEKWLIDNAPSGVDTRENTVFFINWYGRPDFKFHVYTKFGEPDPDTGYDFGVNRHSRKIVAWGGTTPDDEETGLGNRRGVNRVWFYDLSAGPESWGGSYNVDDHDIDGDGQTDYRLPVAWEYAANGYRSPSALAGDLSKMARFGAINLLFASSPLYPPYITPPTQPGSINLDMNTYEGMTGVDASSAYQKLDLLAKEIGEVHRVPYSADSQDVAFTGQAYDCYVKFLNGAKCMPEYSQYPAWANLYLFGALNQLLWRDSNGAGEYLGAFFNYATTDALAAPYLGFADDNWYDGTQSATFNFVSPGILRAGYGLTTTQIHEYGHHFGMSHPHDGYDPESGVDYGPSGAYFFAWVPDESNSVMSYIDLNWDYSQFDRDNANRFQAAAYLTNANAILASIRAAGKESAVSRDIATADESFAAAQAAMASHDYAATFDNAKSGFVSMLAAASKAGVTLTPSRNGWYVQPPRKELNGAPAKRRYSYEDRIGPGTKRSAE